MEESKPFDRTPDSSAEDMHLEDAVTSEYIAFSFLLEHAREADPAAQDIIETQLRAQDPAILAFLVKRARAECIDGGDCPAFDCLCRHFHDFIFRYFVNFTGDKEIGLELTQDTFLQAWLYLPRANDKTERNFKAWIKKIAHNLAMDYHDRSRVPVQSLHNLEEESAAGFPSTRGPEEDISTREMLKLALAQIPSRWREALQLEVFHYGTQQEKAKLLGITESTFSGYVSRGRKELKKAYERLVGGA